MSRVVDRVVGVLLAIFGVMLIFSSEYAHGYSAVCGYATGILAAVSGAVVIMRSST